jgi:hypothetical protein
MNRIIRIAGSLLLLAYSAEGTNELWEMSVTVNMAGMPMAMPSQTMKQCLPKNWAQQPMADPNSKDCKFTDYKLVGNKATWRMQCSSGMTGSGEMTHTSDSMTGTTTMTTGQGAMTQTMVGKRVGTCDAIAEKQKTDALNKEREAQNQKFAAQAKDSKKTMCESYVKQWSEDGGYQDGNTVFGKDGLCPTYQPKLCSAARDFVATYEGYAAYKKTQASAQKMQATGAKNIAWGWVLSACQIDFDQQRAQLCQRSNTDKNYDFAGANCHGETKILCEQSVTDKKYDFAIANCPVQAKMMNEKYCSGFGLDYTADMNRPDKDMCRALRGGGVAKVANQNGGDAAPPSTSDKPATKAAGDTAPNAPKPPGTAASKAIDAAKKLKGILGF